MDVAFHTPQRRAHPRRPAAARCVVSDGIVERHTRLADLSSAGARIATAIPPEVGAQIQLVLLPGLGDPIVLNAIVVWRSEGFRGRGGVMGVRFVGNSDGIRLRTYLERPDLG